MQLKDDCLLFKIWNCFTLINVENYVLLSFIHSSFLENLILFKHACISWLLAWSAKYIYCAMVTCIFKISFSALDKSSEKNIRYLS